jgi:hypothetical protein
MIQRNHEKSKEFRDPGLGNKACNLPGRVRIVGDTETRARVSHSSFRPTWLQDVQPVHLKDCGGKHG